ncbi:GNAT family N-acetyltransferase [Legionella taurinensis]|uniref:GNAT family N-acetyltransferase n=1 Tax=Legionella taurinensis TaxID=70611 RepID=A0A3A5LD46_9GAMM|nr:GNAT family N-acetyltransferase [Legionella taurinensis]MDX1838573.1 GNAT family N-acetyltransferase [Legionella taurinensis]PUT39019.1 GNAT family N-acetyltransferase [Legionella taurinensis]PUT41106.1 GNAT family N-acetyltransferase [Legionella taurinensis]PUT43481.1 GNAT family N-acetyltransferase [Legionella taurinensis]PUT46498.1 GNAT family N-acetyltransferase [Legionella taurinensis]
MITTSIQPFKALATEDIYDILALRNQVFIIEQQCVYLDADYQDQSALHVQLRDNKTLAAYARLLPYDKNTMSFGRVIVAPAYRGQGLARHMMTLILNHLQEHYPHQDIAITAQHYLQTFYEQYGFVARDTPFDLDGILHVFMVKTP